MIDRAREERMFARDIAAHLQGIPGRGTVVWQMTDRGLGSELLLMLIGCLYAAERRMKFVLSSRYWNFACPLGWRDYFEPFCEEIDREELAWHGLHEPEGDELTTRLAGQRQWLEPLLGETPTLTRDIFWSHCWHPSTNERRYRVDELAIDGDAYHACRRLLEGIWRFNAETAAAVEGLIASLPLAADEPYCALHVRRGDKLELEEDPFDLRAYLDRMSAVDARIGTCFVLTDDHDVLIELRRLAPGIRFVSFVLPSERGYFQAAFNALTAKRRRADLIRLLAGITIAARSRFFVGTFTSNIGKLMALLMGVERTHGVDIPFSLYHEIGCTRADRKASGIPSARA